MAGGSGILERTFMYSVHDVQLQYNHVRVIRESADLTSTSPYASTCVASFPLLNGCGACLLSKFFSLIST